MSVFRTALLSMIALLAAASSAFAYTAVSIGTFVAPVDVRINPGWPAQLYVVEKPGRIILLRNEVRTAAPFLDITGLVLDFGEQGLLSLAFPPDHNRSRRFYVMFVNKDGNVEIDEFQRSAANPYIADPASRRIVLVVPHPIHTNHNGGQMHFTADGLLFISIGDGGSGGNEARRLPSLLGKVLRINPLPAGPLAYQIPPDNPFVGKYGRDEIYAYGLRNPWRMSIQGNVMSIGDVGQSNAEEVDMMTIGSARGVNFGWPQYEGNLLYDPARPGPDAPKFPIFTYDHSGERCAIIGGYIIRDTGLPALRGRYLYADRCNGEIRSFIPYVAAQTASGDAALGLTLAGISSFGTGIGGQIYIAAGSKVYRLEP